MVLIFVFATSLVLEISFIGRITGTEVLGIIYIIFVSYKRNFNIKYCLDTLCSYEKIFYILSLFWLIGAVITDVYCETPLDDVARGWSKIIFFVINFSVVRILVGVKIDRLMLFIYFLFVSLSIKLALGIGDANLDGEELLGSQVFGNAWKFGYGQVVTLSIFLLAAKLNSISFFRVAGRTLPFIATALNLALDARNLFGLTALSAIIGALTAGRQRATSPVTICTVGLLCIVLGFGLISVYSYAAEQGFIGKEAQDKYRAQSKGNLNILVAGRTESLASTQAIIDSPILGHGSWARNMTYVQLMLSRLQEAGIDTPGGAYFGGDLIPTHSHLLGAWVEHGLLGAVFWFWALWLTIRGIYATIRFPTSATGFIAFIGLTLVWDIFFSPFGLDGRVMAPACLYLMMLVAKRMDEHLRPKHKNYSRRSY